MPTRSRKRRGRRRRAAEPRARPSYAEAGLSHPFTPVQPITAEEILAGKRAAHLRRAAKAWGAEGVTKFAIPDSEAYLERAFASRKTAHEFLARRSPKELTALGIVKLHGGALPGMLLTTEAELRGLVEIPKTRGMSWPYDCARRLSPPDPVSSMIEALALVPRQSSWHRERFPDVVLHPSLESLVEPAMGIPWPGEVLEEPKKTFVRAPEDVQEEFDRIADYLIGRRSFPVNKHGWPTKPVLAGIAKALRVSSADPWSVQDERASRRGDWKDEKKRHRPFSSKLLSLEEPYPLPDPEGLLGGLIFLGGLVEVDPLRRRGRLLRKTWEDFKMLPAEERACVWLRVWLEMVLWQDGIGKVPDKDDRYLPERIDPDELLPAKHTILWGLSLLPREGWVSLDEFLLQLQRLTSKRYGISLCWERFVWGPRFSMPGERTPAGPERSRGLWRGVEGIWVANVLLVSFVWLGLVERGEIGRGKERRYVFRLSGPPSPVSADRRSVGGRNPGK